MPEEPREKEAEGDGASTIVRAALARFEASVSDPDDVARMAAELRRAADEHAEVLRRSRELGDKRIYRDVASPEKARYGSSSCEGAES